MNTNIKSTNISLTPAISDYVNKRLETLVELLSHHDSGARIDVEVGKVSNHHKSGDIFRAEVNVHTKGVTLRAVNETTDLYSAIDQVKDDIVEEVKRHHGKKRALFKRGASKVKDIIKGIKRR